MLGSGQRTRRAPPLFPRCDPIVQIREIQDEEADRAHCDCFSPPADEAPAQATAAFPATARFHCNL